MSCDLIGNLEGNGFRLAETGGGCRAMVLSLRDNSIVATSSDGDLPYEDDFLVVVYRGNWLTDADAPEVASFGFGSIGDAPASGLAPIDEALEQARRAASERVQ